ncbi:MAG: hypothetical protein K2L02_04170 [Clostridia bacterium]|nr:hypothetical protein [Clostridia bacterium]
MTKTEKIRRIYAIALGVFIVAMGIALICVAADIYYSGEGPGKYYSREIVGDRLKKLAIPLLFLIAAIIAGAIFPIWEAKGKNVWATEDALKRLQRKLPASGEGEEFATAQKQYQKMKMIKIILWCSALAVALIGAILTLVYVVNTSHFEGSDFGKQMLGLLKVVLPCLIVAFAVYITVSYLSAYFSKKQINCLKTMIRFGSGEIAEPKEQIILNKVNKIASHDITLWVVRGVVLALAVTFIGLGIWNGGAQDVLIKAINICRECIGIG